ncbi:hypothetical protein BWQ96_08342 [Gracilariopsis chorda]|uniref:Transforming acidic coiled-coil-containing protein C-terminal domain-containing protein n=1 Tax=Gracilariopsis chorda TaxID=448386 RepID=A0A2V3IIN5_9FLOR|nr:hypothetical protein BWQ96_08342 [Gracilariopsis chorda]|eukprot:PXF41932.1 hypothetical protein BWQ96_08342 [Gracilariopsis chorda]
MASSSDSPDIIFREKAAPLPTFDGVALPAALRELRSTENNRPSPPSSEMTALAQKFRSVYLHATPQKSDSDIRQIEEHAAPTNSHVSQEKHSEKENEPSEMKRNKILNGIDLFQSEKETEMDYEMAAVHKSHDSRFQDVSSAGNVEKPPQIAPNNALDSKSSRPPLGLQSAERKGNFVEKSNVPSGKDHGEDSAKSRQANTDNLTNPIPSPSAFVPSSFEADLRKILEGKKKWSWPQRKDALLSLAKTVAMVPKEADQILGRSINAFASAISDHLEELRPTVITSALDLINIIVLRKLSMANEFANEVFPSVMDVVCGRSLTAESAAKTLVHLLQFDEKLATNLRDADNPERLLQLITKLAESGDISVKEGACKAIVAIRSEVSSGLRTPSRPTSIPTNASPGSIATEIGKAEVLNPESGFRSGRISARSTPNIRRVMGLRKSSVLRNLQGVRPSTDLLEYSSATRSGNYKSMTPGSELLPLDVRSGASVLRNMKLSDSVRKISPSPSRGRMFSEEDVEVIKNNSVALVVDKLKASHSKELQRRSRDVDDMHKKLKRERAEVQELRSVLEQYQLTMKKMVSEGNSKANAQQILLEKEKNKLKAELLERSDAFEKLKERYENAKEAIVVYENKENRFIEQIKELKRNMVELQKWSNDLKANSEKKLTIAFESVTAYRASYIDKEAHANKALSDLERTTAELEKAQQSHAETAAKFAQIEAELHKEQDLRATAEAALSTAKSSLARTTIQRDQLQKELSTAEDELSGLRSQVGELQQSRARLSEVEKTLEGYTVEGQTLKARAYDDMIRIRELEDNLEAKNKECDELHEFCNEIMERLERSEMKGK